VLRDVLDGHVPPARGHSEADMFEAVESSAFTGAHKFMRLCVGIDGEVRRPGHRKNRAQFRQFNGPSIWRVLLERKMTPQAVVVAEVAGDLPPRRSLIH